MESLLDRIENMENKLPILVRLSENQISQDTYFDALLFVSNKLEELRMSPPSSTLIDVERNIEYRRYTEIKTALLKVVSISDFYSRGNIELY